MTTATSKATPFYVVRNRNGRFVRAFVNEWQAASWVERHPVWTYATEYRHTPDADGRVFDWKVSR